MNAEKMTMFIKQIRVNWSLLFGGKRFPCQQKTTINKAFATVLVLKMPFVWLCTLICVFYCFLFNYISIITVIEVLQYAEYI